MLKLRNRKKSIQTFFLELTGQILVLKKNLIKQISLNIYRSANSKDIYMHILETLHHAENRKNEITNIFKLLSCKCVAEKNEN